MSAITESVSPLSPDDSNPALLFEYLYTLQQIHFTGTLGYQFFQTIVTEREHLFATVGMPACRILLRPDFKSGFLHKFYDFINITSGDKFTG